MMAPEALSRCIAGVVLGAALQGCLAPTPPALEDPEQTRPFVITRLVDPPLGQVVKIAVSSVGVNPPYKFTVGFQSEDRGEGVAAGFHMDFDTGEAQRLDIKLVPPGEWTDNARTLTFEYTFQASPRVYGCHHLTVILTHFDKFDQTAGTVLPEYRDTDAEMVSWLAHVFDPSVDDIDTLVGCSRLEPDDEAGDAGE